MATTTTATEAGPRPLLAYLLMHHSADAAALASALDRSDEQVQRSLSRLQRRGLITMHGDCHEIAPHCRPAVADYTEGALSLRELAQAGR
jgi:predicted transcriptional regulator